MPLTRCQIRNEYGLADPELYRAADKDDPEALLEGVAMAGLVGVLRQLGDLAEFAAEIFHDLHEEVMATAARGHGLMARVQQLEAEVPSIERAFLSQTDHSSFFSSAGVDWHPNLRMDQNVITRGDLPRFVMDSYEECRGPPRLFLLDKFDIAGAGACLKRYTDPSFFKIERVGEISVEIPRERKSRKIKKKGSRWRNGETPEVAPASHPKLHQLLLEERVENAHPDPARVVKLKRRQLNGFPFDVKPEKSYMEKVLETFSPEHKIVHEVSVTPPALKLKSDNSSESGLEIVEISSVIPAEQPPNAHVVLQKPFTNELNGEAVDRGIVETADQIVDGKTDESPSTVQKMMIEEELRVDADERLEGSLGGHHSDDLASELDNYMDALTTMDSEMETDNEYNLRKQDCHFNVFKYQSDSDGNDEHMDDRANFSDSQSIGVSSISDDRNGSLQKGMYSFSFSDSSKSLSENILFNGEVAAQGFSLTGDGLTETMADKSNNECAHGVTPGTESCELDLPEDLHAEKGKIHNCEETSSNSCSNDSDMYLPSVPLSDSLIDPSPGHESNEAPSSFIMLASDPPHIVEKGTNLTDPSVFIPDTASQTAHDVLPMHSSEIHAVRELNEKDTTALSNALVDSVPGLDLSPETENEVLQIHNAGAISDENLVVVKSDSQHSVVSPKDKGSPSLALLGTKLDSGDLSVPSNSDTSISNHLISRSDENLVVAKSDSQHSVVSPKDKGSPSLTLPGTKVDSGDLSVPDHSDTSISDHLISQSDENLVVAKSDSQHSVVSPKDKGSPSFTLPGTKVDSGDLSVPENLDSSISDCLISQSDENLVVAKSDSQHSVVSPKDKSSPSLALPGTMVDSGNFSVPDNSDTSISDHLLSQADDITTIMSIDFDNASTVVDALEANVSKEHEHSNTTADPSGVECESTEIEVPFPEHSNTTADPTGVECESTEIEVPFPEEKLIELCGDTETEKMGTNTVESVESKHIPPQHPYICLDKPGPDIDANLDDLASENGKVENLTVSAVVACPINAGVVGDIVSPSSYVFSSQSEVPQNKEESFSSTEIPDWKSLNVMETVSLECHSEPKMQKGPEQTEIDYRDVDFGPHNLGFNEHSNGVIHHSCLVEETPNSLYDSDAMTGPSLDISSQELESNNTCKIHYLDERGNDGGSEARNSLEHQSNELQPHEVGAQSVQAAAEESNSKLMTVLTSPPCYLAEPKNALEHPIPSQFNQLDSEYLQVIEASSNQSYLHNEQVETLNPPDTERCLDDISNSCMGNLPSRDLLVIPAREELHGFKCIGNWVDSVSSSLDPILNAAHVSTDEAPPLPPLPPMQWRLGRAQSSLQAPEKEWITDTQDTFTSTESYTADQKAPYEITSLDRMVDPSSNPPISTVGSPTSRHFISEESTGQLLHPASHSLEEPSVANEKVQQDCTPLEATQPLISPLNSQETSNEKLERNFIPSGDVLLPFTSSLPSQVPTVEHMTSEHDPVSSKGLPDQPSIQSASMTSPELEVEHGNHPEKSVMAVALSTEQPQLDVVAPQEDAKWPPSTLSLPPTYESGKSNRNKLPRNPLIDAVAAHDKSKLRKVTERVRPQIGPKLEERNSLLEQIRTKSFNLKPATLARPRIQGIPAPNTNLKVAAILEKANAIRQALTGSDEDDDSDSWSDS